jgi:glycerol kinase
LLQFQAELLDAEVIRPRCIETTAFGAACLAGLATGFWSDREELARVWAVDETFRSGRSRDEILGLRTGWERALERARGWAQP